MIMSLPMLATSGLVMLLHTADALVVSMDIFSNGRYWWGARWSHKPRHGDTKDCVCMTGTLHSGAVEVGCLKDYRFPRHGDSNPFSIGDLNWDRPVEISILGDDALWVDRFQVNRNNERGGGRRWYGADNTAGYCLSTDAGDTNFDQYASVSEGRCYSAFSLHADGNVRGRYYAAEYLQRKAEASCALAKRRAGRRIEVLETLAEVTTDAEGHPLEDVVVVATPVLVDADENASEEDDESDAATGSEELVSDSADPKAVRAPVVAELRAAIHELIRNGVDVSDAEMDALLDKVLLTEEHRQEAAAHDGEVADDSEGAPEEVVTKDDDDETDQPTPVGRESRRLRAFVPVS